MVEITNNKNVYAAFSNMAQDNLYMVFNHILKCLGKNAENNAADKILQTFASKKVNEKAKAIDLLNRHLPFMEPLVASVMDKKGNNFSLPEAYAYVIKRIVEIARFYRNYTTHYDSDESGEILNLNSYEGSMCHGLNELFKASIRVVRQRYGYTEDDVKFVANRGKAPGNEKSYKYFLHKTVTSAANSTQRKEFSLKGLVFFLCLLLEKKYISEFLDKTKAFYTYQDLTNPKRKSILLESIAVYRVKLPRKRYDSETSLTVLALDIMNELQRCPRELFDILSPADQKLFRSVKGDENGESVLMMRSSDRFPTLAMRWIDLCETFKQIRFQINLGKYRFAFYNKRCIKYGEDNGVQVRSLEKELHGFGRLDNIEKERREKWATLIREYDEVREDTADSVPYITDHRASYLISNNRVGLYWKASVTDPFPGLPQLSTTPQARDLRERKKAGEKLASLATPKCFLSVHELPPLVFYTMLFKQAAPSVLQKSGAISAEAIIMRWVKNFHSFIDGVLSGEISKDNCEDKAANLGIDYKRHLPKKLQEFISGSGADEQVLNKRLRDRLDKHIADTERRIERHRRDAERQADEANKRGKKNFVEIKPGRLGSWLAHDMIAMQPQPRGGENKLTGLNFQILQSALSMFDNLENMRQVLISARLIGSSYSHPFLEKVLNKQPRNTIELYKIYLDEKVAWLRSLKPEEIRALGFITRGTDKWSVRDEEYYKRVLLRYKTMPVELPRGLFSQAIKKLLSEQFGPSFVKGETRDEANVSFLVSKYFRDKCNDDSQEFYTQPNGTYKRYYTFFRLLAGAPTLKSVPEYGKIVTEIDAFLKSDPSLDLLLTKQHADVATAQPTFDLSREIEEVNIKLVKAKAKNPNLDVAKRIEEIISSSMKLKSLSPAQKMQLMSKFLGKNVASAQNQPRLVEKYLNGIEKSEREQEKVKLSRTLRLMKETERLIRNYRVTDILLFLMARNILFAEDEMPSDAAVKHFKLSEIRPIRRQDGVGTLEIKIPFSITLHIKGSNVPVRITQDSIKLKNYGDFQKFLYDTRLETLIPYLVDDENAVRIDVSKAELDDEFAKYDTARIEVFANVHKIERLILERHSELKDKTSASYYYQENGKNLPVRGNFGKMLSYDKRYADEEQSEMVNIRNSFSHNSYRGDGFGNVNISTSKVGEIAPAIKGKLKNKADQISADAKKDNVQN